MTREQSDAISNLQAQADHAEATLRASLLVMYRRLAPQTASKHAAAVERLMEYLRAESHQGTFKPLKDATGEVVAQVNNYYDATAALYNACREAGYDLFIGARSWRDARAE